MKKASLKQNQKGPQIMSPVAKKKIESNSELQDPSANFSKLNNPEESINTYILLNLGEEWEWKSDFSANLL